MARVKSQGSPTDAQNQSNPLRVHLKLNIFCREQHALSDFVEENVPKHEPQRHFFETQAMCAGARPSLACELPTLMESTTRHMIRSTMQLSHQCSRQIQDILGCSKSLQKLPTETV